MNPNLLTRLDAHIRQLAPHAAVRDSGQLLIEARAALVSQASDLAALRAQLDECFGLRTALEVAQQRLATAEAHAKACERGERDALAQLRAAIEALQEVDDVFSKFGPSEDSSYGLVWAKVKAEIDAAKSQLPKA